jgi:hypothetical protein
MTRRSSIVWLLAGASVLALGAYASSATAQPSARRLERPGAENFRSESLTPFEKNFLSHIRQRGELHQDEARPPEENNARGLRLEGGDAAIVNLSVWGRKYGISLDGTRDVLIKNFSFTHRRSKDQYGAGLIMGGKAGTKGVTFLSNAWIDLKESGPEPDYKKANNEAISVERNNRPLNVRRSVLIGGAESGLDNKGDVVMDASFIASGHRPVRIWSGGSLLLVNSTVLAFPDFGGFWFGGGEGVARLDYYNCKFGRVGDQPEDLTSTIPDWMVTPEADDPVDIRIRKLSRDPLDRGPGSFWVPASTPTPPGYLGRRR